MVPTLQVPGQHGSHAAPLHGPHVVGQPAPCNVPEGLVSVNFAGIASYATFDFDSTDADRYIIDNFEGTFGSTEVEPPEPPVTPPRPTLPQVPIPTLSEWGLILTIFGVLLLASRRLRRL